MYTVRVVVSFDRGFDDETAIVMLEKTFQLPFAPYPGLRLQVEEEPSRERPPALGPLTILIDEVEFNPFDGTFNAGDSRDTIEPPEVTGAWERWLRGAGFTDHVS